MPEMLAGAVGRCRCRCGREPRGVRRPAPNDPRGAPGRPGPERMRRDPFSGHHGDLRTEVRGATPVHVLVTGHEGYLGAIVSRTLQQAGHQITGLDTGYYRGCDLGPEPEPL